MRAFAIMCALLMFACGEDETPTPEKPVDPIVAKQTELDALKKQLKASGEKPSPEVMMKALQLQMEIEQAKSAKMLEAMEAAGTAPKGGNLDALRALKAQKAGGDLLEGALGGALGEALEGAGEALEAMGTDGKIDMGRYKKGLGKQLDAMEGFGADSGQLDNARKAMRNLPSTMPTMPARPSMPSMPAMPSMPSMGGY